MKRNRDEICRKEEKGKPRAKPPSQEPMLEMGIGLSMQIRESAVANDISMFERLVGKKVVIDIYDSAPGVVATMTKNGKDFIELEGVVWLHFSLFDGLAEIKKFVATDFGGFESERQDSLVLNKSDIRRISAVDSIKNKED